MRPIRNIMLSTDFSDSARAATELAIDFAQKFGARLTLLHVLDAPSYVGAFGDIYYAVPSSVTDEVRADAERALMKLGLLTADTGVMYDTLVVEGTPRSAIVAAAQSRQIDLIVMGTHGRTGLRHLMLGSVAETVIRTADCPVVTVRDGAARATARAS